MKKLNMLILLSVCTPSMLFSQIQTDNAENFEVGDTLVFQSCKADNVSAGNSGENQIWDFSALTKDSETITEYMLSPSSTIYGDKFPNATIVEEYSDGKLVFLDNRQNESKLVGFVSLKDSIFMEYPDPIVLMKRPLKYMDEFTDDFTVHFTVRNLNFQGSGNVKIKADAFGKLILPNQTYENVLRVKMVQTQNDELLEYHTKSSTETISYFWFNETNKSALLKITEVKSDYFSNRTVEYLIEENKKE